MSPPRGVALVRVSHGAADESEEVGLLERSVAVDNAGGDSEAEDEGVARASLEAAAPRAPLDEAGAWSRATFSWLNPLLKLGEQRQLQASDIPVNGEGDDADTVRLAFDAAWTNAAPGKHRLARALLTMERDVLLRAGLAKCVDV